MARRRGLRCSFASTCGEQCVRGLLPTGGEKLATHFLTFVTLAMIQRCLRLLEPSNRT